MRESVEKSAPVFTQPDIWEEQGEFVRVARLFRIDESALMYLAEHESRLVSLSDDIWDTLENTDSRDIELNDWESVERVGIEVGRDVQSIRTAIESGKSLPAPIILQHGDQHHLVAGNTRLVVAKAVGVRPQVLIVEAEKNG